MPKDAVLAVIAGLAGASLFFPALAGGPVGAVVSSASALPLIMVGLGLGERQAILAAVVGTVALMAFGVAVGLAFLLVDVLPSLLVVGLGLRGGSSGEWYPVGKIAGWLAVVAAVVLIAGLASVPPHAEGIGAGVLEVVDQAVATWAPEMTPEDRRGIAESLALILPWQVMKSWALRVLILGVIAQWAVTRMQRGVRPTPDYIGLELPTWIVAVFLTTLGMALTAPGDAGYLARNAGFVLGLPLFLLGLTVVHTLARRGANPQAILVAFYIGYAVSAWSYVAVVGLGLAEHWIRLHQRRLGSRGRDGDGSRSA